MSKIKIRTARAINVNLGLRRTYIKKLIRLKKQFQNYVFEQILVDLDNAGLMAQDWSLSNPKTTQEKEQLKQLKRKILREMARHDPEWVRNHIDKFVQKNLAKWQAGFGKGCEQVATWFVRNQVLSVANAQKAAIRAAHGTLEVIKKQWTVPLIRNQYVAPSVVKLMPQIIKDQTSLITKIALEDVNRIADVIQQGLTGGDDLTKLRETLSQTDGFDAARVERVVVDQTGKANAQMQIAGAKDLGVQYGIWKHVPGLYTSRETHKKMDGKKFDLAVGLFDADVGKNVLPAECINCRCQFRMCLPDWATKEDQKMDNQKLAFDHFSLKKSVRTIDDNGFLHVAVSAVTREQVAPYRGNEIPNYQELGFNADAIYYGYRPASELSKEDTIRSLNGIPIQFEHHTDYAAAPAKMTRIGSTGTDAKWDAPYLTNSLHFQDKAAIDRIIDGSMKELSLGYRYEPIRKKGTFNGQDYDFVMTDISCNHLALVEEGRAGHEVCVGDAKLKQGEQMSDPISKAVETMAQGILDVQQENEQENDPVKNEVQMDGKLEKLLAAMKANGEDLSKYEDILNGAEDDDLVEDPTDEQDKKPAEDDELASEENKATEGLPAEDEDDDLDKTEQEVNGDDEGEEEKPADVDAEDEDEQEKTAEDEGEDLPDEIVTALKNAKLENASDEVKAAFVQGFKSCAHDCGEKALAQDAALKKSYAELAERRCAQRYNAAEECSCVLGHVKAMAYDSAGAIYRDAVKHMGIKGYAKMKSNEARSVFRALQAQKRGEIMAKDRALTNAKSDAVLNILNNIKVGV